MAKSQEQGQVVVQDYETQNKSKNHRNQKKKPK